LIRFDKTNKALSVGGKSNKFFNSNSISKFQLVVASIKNEHSKGSTIDSPAFEQLSVPNDSPAFKQHPVPNDDPAIESSLQLHIPMIATSIQHEAFDNFLSCHPSMNISNTTSVPATLIMIANMTLSYLHPAKMMAVNATSRSLFLICNKDNLEITTPSLLLPFY
jgi:hypothetical protein